MASRFEMYRDALGKFRWRLLATNDKIIAKGGESYESKTAALSAITSVRKSGDVPIEDTTE